MQAHRKEKERESKEMSKYVIRVHVFYRISSLNANKSGFIPRVTVEDSAPLRESRKGAVRC